MFRLPSLSSGLASLVSGGFPGYRQHVPAMGCANGGMTEISEMRALRAEEERRPSWRKNFLNGAKTLRRRWDWGIESDCRILCLQGQECGITLN